jgi:hypothetical protein
MGGACTALGAWCTSHQGAACATCLPCTSNSVMMDGIFFAKVNTALMCRASSVSGTSSGARRSTVNVKKGSPVGPASTWRMLTMRFYTYEAHE